MTLAPAADETQESPQADPPLLDRRDGAEALVTGRARSDLARRSDGRLVAAGDGPLTPGQQGASQMPIHHRTCVRPPWVGAPISA